MDQVKVIDLSRALQREEVQYIVVGGAALAIQGPPRATQAATPQTLYWMKRDTVRPQDRLDAARLKAQFRIEEE